MISITRNVNCLLTLKQVRFQKLLFIAFVFISSSLYSVELNFDPVEDPYSLLWEDGALQGTNFFVSRLRTVTHYYIYTPQKNQSLITSSCCFEAFDMSRFVTFLRQRIQQTRDSNETSLNCR